MAIHSLSVRHRWASFSLKPSIRRRSKKMETVFVPHGWHFHSLSVSHRWDSCPFKPSVKGRSPEAVFRPHGWQFHSLSVRHRLASFKTFKTFNQRTFPGGCISPPWVAVSQPQCQSQVGQLFFLTFSQKTFQEDGGCIISQWVAISQPLSVSYK